MSDGILKKIKSRGYWRVNFRPITFVKEKITPVTRCKEIVRNAVVELRGWDYPHFPSDSQEIRTAQNYIEAWIDWGAFKELWRMYQSGQFIHYLGLREDEPFWMDPPLRTLPPGTVLGIVGVVFTVTEIFEFLARLSKQGIYEDGVSVDIGLFNTKSRELKVFDPGRAPLFGKYISGNSEIRFSKQYSEKETLEQSKDLALEVILRIFRRFNWDNPPLETIRSDQQRLLERRF